MAEENKNSNIPIYKLKVYVYITRTETYYG